MRLCAARGAGARPRAAGERLRAGAEAGSPGVKAATLPPLAALWGEALGTFIMVLFGTGAVACAVLTGALQGLWQVAVVWGCGVALAIYVSAGLSGAHLNPAVTAAFALLRPTR